MKSRTFLMSLIATMAIGSTGTLGYQYYSTSIVNKQSDLLLENIEVLASDDEFEKNKITCYSSFSGIGDTTDNAINVTKCYPCGARETCREAFDRSTCVP